MERVPFLRMVRGGCSNMYDVGVGQRVCKNIFLHYRAIPKYVHIIVSWQYGDLQWTCYAV